MEREEWLDEVVTAYLKTVEAGGNIDPADWISRYPDLADDLKERVRPLARPPGSLARCCGAPACGGGAGHKTAPGDDSGPPGIATRSSLAT